VRGEVGKPGEIPFIEIIILVQSLADQQAQRQTILSVPSAGETAQLDGSKFSIEIGLPNATLGWHLAG
jgi:hypothetical protein